MAVVLSTASRLGLIWQLYSVLLVGLDLELKHVINKTIVLYTV